MSENVRDLVFECPLFDDHEHFSTLPELAAGEDSYLSFAGYAVADLNTSLGPSSPGKPFFPAERNSGFDRVFFSAWRKSRNTAYCRAIERACRDILGLEYQEGNIDSIGRKLTELKGETGEDVRRFFTEVLSEKAGIRWAVKDSVYLPEQTGDDLYADFVRMNYRDDLLLVAPNRDTIIEREARWQRSIDSLDDLLDGYMDSITRCLATGKVTSFKIGLAYSRGLDFGYPSKSDAERVFNRMMFVGRGERVLRQAERVAATPNPPAIPQLSGDELRPLHDYLVHVYIQRATDEGKPVQIHTGYLAGNYGDLRNINPMQLVPILLTYRTTRFDLFHAGWPYVDELGTIGKNFPNVWLSLCWAWTMNSITMERALDAWLDGVPYNKILGFGGDTGHPIAAYGYAMQAREGLARVFERRVARGDMDGELARDAVRAILFTNGCELHGLPLSEVPPTEE